MDMGLDLEKGGVGVEGVVEGVEEETGVACKSWNLV